MRPAGAVHRDFPKWQSRRARQLADLSDSLDAAPSPRSEDLLSVNDSLSIIVPVRNVEATLPEQVHHLLDLLPDLTSRFEIIVVDDGSTDHTLETARELASQYPQVRLRSHAQPRGQAEAVRTGLALAEGQTILIQEDSAGPSPTELRRLWSLRHDRGCIMARTQQQPGVFSPELLDRLSTWGQALRNLAKRTMPGGIQMIRRDAAQSLTGRNIAGSQPQVSYQEQEAS
jgi:glycosyltransferase involved in cell wall biosynthesis